MSDYLTRLAERAVGLAQAIAPRVPYRFEQAGISLAGPPRDARPDQPPIRTEDEYALDEAAATDPRPRRAKDIPASSSRHAQESSPAAPRGSRVAPDRYGVRRGSDPQLEAALPTATDLRSGSVSRSKPQPPSSPPEPAVQESRRASREERPGSPANVNARSERRSQQPAPRREADRRTVSTPPTRSERASRGTAAGGRSTEARPVSRDEARPVVRPKENLRPGNKPAFELASELAGRRTVRREDPTVTVTIGRVEVRAVLEPPKPPAKSRKVSASAIPLEAYLERQEARRR